MHNFALIWIFFIKYSVKVNKCLFFEAEINVLDFHDRENFPQFYKSSFLRETIRSFTFITGFRIKILVMRIIIFLIRKRE